MPWTKTGNIRGPQGVAGAPGANGQGVPVGGTTGQALIKNSATNYDTIWSAVQGLPADTVVAAATRIISNKLLAGDTQPAWRIFGSGKMEWGLGGTTVVDTNLYRSAAGWLTTDGSLIVTGKTGYNPGLRIWGASGYEHALQVFKSSADSQPVLVIEAATAQLDWGPGGTTSADTFLYRSGVNALVASGTFSANGTIQSNQTGTGVAFASQSLSSGGYFFTGDRSGDTGWRLLIDSSGIMYWGSGTGATDTNLYRRAAGYLATDSVFYAGKGFVANAMSDQYQAGLQLAVTGDTQDRWYIRADGYMYWGPGNATQDANLYRAWAGTLGTTSGLAFNPGSVGNTILSSAVTSDPNFRWTVGANGTLNWGPGSAASDTNLYRSAAGVLKTDTAFVAGTTIDGDMLQYYGDWVAGSYQDGDVVVYQGVAYMAVRPTSVAPTPWGTGVDLSNYQTRTEKAQASGYASLDGTTKVPVAQIPMTLLPGAELLYAQITAAVTIATSATVIPVQSVTFDGGSYMVEFFTNGLYWGSGGTDPQVYISLVLDGVGAGILSNGRGISAGMGGFIWPAYGRKRIQPSAGVHTVAISASCGAGANWTLQADANTPAFVRVVKV
jgi:hypothetical protein